MSLFVNELGKALKDDELEALVFWCFAAFVEQTGSGLIADNLMKMQEKELSAIMNITQKFHPTCGQWLKSKGLSDLTFLISAIILAYGRTFGSGVIPRIWETLITNTESNLFLRCFFIRVVDFVASVVSGFAKLWCREIDWTDGFNCQATRCGKCVGNGAGNYAKIDG
jgi:hypothetical protein